MINPTIVPEFSKTVWKVLNWNEKLGTRSRGYESNMRRGLNWQQMGNYNPLRKHLNYWSASTLHMINMIYLAGNNEQYDTTKWTSFVTQVFSRSISQFVQLLKSQVSCYEYSNVEQWTCWGWWPAHVRTQFTDYWPGRDLIQPLLSLHTIKYERLLFESHLLLFKTFGLLTFS